MLLVGKDRLDLKGLEINKVRKHSLEVTLQLRSILFSDGQSFLLEQVVTVPQQSHRSVH